MTNAIHLIGVAEAWAIFGLAGAAALVLLMGWEDRKFGLRLWLSSAIVVVGIFLSWVMLVITRWLIS